MVKTGAGRDGNRLKAYDGNIETRDGEERISRDAVDKAILQ